MAAPPVRIRRGGLRPAAWPGVHRAPDPAPRIPRRASGPVHRPRNHRTGPRPVAVAGGAAARGIRRAVAFSQGRLFERLVRGRLWIPILGLALTGIVFMQVSMLSMNAGIGNAVNRSSQLERENAAIRADLSRLAIGNSVSDAAAQAGMVVPASGDYHVLNAGDGDAAQRAAGNLTDPAAPVTSTPATSSTTPAPATANVATPAATTTAPQAVTPSPTATPAQSPATTGAQTTAGTQPSMTTGGGAAAPGA